jgi:hypothetical protein
MVVGLKAIEHEEAERAELLFLRFLCDLLFNCIVA